MKKQPENKQRFCVNVCGAKHYFETATEAAALVREFRENGII